MGKYVDNKSGLSSSKKVWAKRDFEAKKKIKNSVGLKKFYSDIEKRKSIAQAKQDEAFQKRMLASRNR